MVLLNQVRNQLSWQRFVLCLCMLVISTQLFAGKPSIDDVQLAVRQKDFTTASEMLKSIFDQSHSPDEKAEASYLLGKLYRSGNGVQKNQPTAFKYFYFAAKQGHIKASYALASMYEHGRGTAANSKSALHWYQQSAVQGYRQAQTKLDHWEDPITENTQTNIVTSAFDTLRKDDADSLAKYLASGLNVNARDKSGRSLLAQALILDASRCFKLLIVQHPVLLDIDAQGETAVTLAVRLQRANQLRELLKLKPALNQLDGQGNLPLTTAVKLSAIELVQLLLDEGANINALDAESFTALDHAMMLSSNKTKVLLQSAGAKNSAEFRRLNADANELAGSDLEQQHRLLIDTNPALANWPLLHTAAYLDKTALVKHILAQGNAASLKAKDGDTAMDKAVAGGATVSFQTLFTSLSLAEKTSPLLRRLLSSAIDNKQAAIANWLVTRLAKEQRHNIFNSQQMKSACRQQLYDVVKSLVDHIDLITSHEQHQANEHAFFCAIKSGSKQVLENLTIKPNYLKMYDTDGRSALWHAAAQGDLHILNKLTSLGSNLAVNSVDLSGKSPLTAAVAGGHSEAIRWLVRRSANMDSADKRGVTPLMDAVASDDIEIVRLLLDLGADTEIRDGSSYTALMLASAKGDFTMVKLLVDRGANDSRRDHSGMTSEMIARNAGHLSIANYLKK